MNTITEFNITDWNHVFTKEEQQKAIDSLEEGKILFFPNLAYEFNDNERQFLSTDFVCPKTKNVSYDSRSKQAHGVKQSANYQELKNMMHRFSIAATNLINDLVPQYKSFLDVARTSYRPIEVKNRPSSYRKDDSRLHIDAFPSTPMAGKRILRIFSNVNHLQHPRVWRVGERFDNVAAKFLPDIRNPLPFEAQFLKFIKATRDKRTPYDHYMLNIHHKMKADMDYQKNVEQFEFQFHPGSTWMVFTDQVSHAAMNGQFLLEQSYYLPVEAMAHPECSPLKVLEKSLKRKLV